jgi:XTP/dITP diphosphohydrolase
MTTLIVATRNRHKIQEIRAILGPNFEVHDLTAFPAAPTVVEDAPTFEGNATKKAVALVAWLAAENPGVRPLVLADDSGLEVDALNGAPGVHSARFAALEHGAEAQAAGNTPDAANNARLLRLLADVPAQQRTARFRCVLALAGTRSGPSCVDDVKIFDGRCEGRISFAPSGQGGFGYDPLFIPDGHQHSFAELGEEVKNGISHRSRALAQLRQTFEDK